MLSGAWLIKSPEVRFFPVPLIRLIELVENVVLIRTGRRRSPIHVTAIDSVIIADIILISAVLYFSGGMTNALAIFYLVEVVATAVVPGDAWACHDHWRGCRPLIDGDEDQGTACAMAAR